MNETYQVDDFGKSAGKIDALFSAAIFAVALLFILFVVAVDGYPQLNDILGILDISSLEGPSRFLNGFYGPGYTYLAFLIGPSVENFGKLYCSLAVAATFLTYQHARGSGASSVFEEKTIFYYVAFCFLVIILSTLRLNHTDGIFLLILYSGSLIFCYGAYTRNNLTLTFLGAFTVGISLLFRHHGTIFVVLCAALFLYVNYSPRQEFVKRQSVRRVLLLAMALFAPAVLSMLHLGLTSSISNWQNFNLYRFLYGVNWKEIHLLLVSEQYQSFSIVSNVIHEPWVLMRALRSHARDALPTVLPFMMIILVNWIATKDKIHFLLLAFFCFYVSLILPSWNRGYFPAILITLLSLFLSVNKVARTTVPKTILLLSITLLALMSAFSFARAARQTYLTHVEVRDEVRPILDRHGVTKSEEMFTDDFDLYINYLRTESYKMCSWGGWIFLHPRYYPYHPEETIRGIQTDFCDVRVLITRDSQLADRLVEQGVFTEKHQTKNFFLVLRKKEHPSADQTS